MVVRFGGAKRERERRRRGDAIQDLNTAERPNSGSSEKTKKKPVASVKPSETPTREARPPTHSGPRQCRRRQTSEKERLIASAEPSEKKGGEREREKRGEENEE